MVIPIVIVPVPYTYALCFFLSFAYFRTCPYHWNESIYCSLNAQKYQRKEAHRGNVRVFFTVERPFIFHLLSFRQIVGYILSLTCSSRWKKATRYSDPFGSTYSHLRTRFYEFRAFDHKLLAKLSRECFAVRNVPVRSWRRCQKTLGNWSGKRVMSRTSPISNFKDIHEIDRRGNTPHVSVD